IRFEYSKETSVWRADGSSPLLKRAMVGSESSSATQGSSTFSVAGRKRAPTKQCALAWVSGIKASASPGRALRMIRLNMGLSIDGTGMDAERRPRRRAISRGSWRSSRLLRRMRDGARNEPRVDRRWRLRRNHDVGVNERSRLGQQRMACRRAELALIDFA